MTSDIDLNVTEERADEAREAVARDLEQLRERTEEIVGEVKQVGDAGRWLVPAAGGALAIGTVAIGGLGVARVLGRVLLGATAGIAAGIVMNKVHPALTKAFDWLGVHEPESSGPPATVKAAEKVAGPIEPSDRERAGSIAHHTMAATTGAIYALASSASDTVTIGRGAAYGASVWLVADEVAVPALGLGAPPWRSPIATHVRALAAHLVYGLVLDACVRAVRVVSADPR